MCAVTSHSHMEGGEELAALHPCMGAGWGRGASLDILASSGGRILPLYITVGDKLGPRVPVHPQPAQGRDHHPLAGELGGAPGGSAARCEAGDAEGTALSRAQPGVTCHAWPPLSILVASLGFGAPLGSELPWCPPQPGAPPWAELQVGPEPPKVPSLGLHAQ